MTHISTILDRKGTSVTTVRPDARLTDVIRLLAEHNIGALVVSRDGNSMEGIISERDIVRRLAASGPECLAESVAEAMSTDVVTCPRDATVDELASTMTERRVRHIPVVESGRLLGLVSIGDVVKSRIIELEVQAQALENYVSGSNY